MALAEALIERQPTADVQPALLIDADSIPELQLARHEAANEAARILSGNRDLLMEGDFDSVPIPVDALGTAKRLVDAKEEFGEDSEQYSVLFDGLVLDSERLLGEAFRKNKSEYFAEVEQKRNPETGEYHSHGLSIRGLSANGLTPVAEPEEQDRRGNEFVEELTYEAIGRAIGGVMLQSSIELQANVIPITRASTGLSELLDQATDPQRGVSAYTVSECTDWAIEAYENDSKGSHGGYVPAIKKNMLRGVRFTESGDRYEEQLAISGVYVTHEVILDVLKDSEALAESDNLTKTELHGKQFIDTEAKGVIDFAEQLDLKASEVYGKNIFMGEEVPEDHPKDYSQVAVEAESRRRKLAPKPTELAEYLIELEEKGTERWAAEGIIDTYLKEVLLDVARDNPDKAEEMFDKATADGLRKVATLRSMGLNDEAKALQFMVEKNAPSVSYCGAGSCGIVRAPSGRSAAKAYEAGLKGELLLDTERACPGCGAMEVHYDGEGNKACGSCGNSQVKGKKSKKPDDKE